jgi:hypothetical protein
MTYTAARPVMMSVHQKEYEMGSVIEMISDKMSGSPDFEVGFTEAEGEALCIAIFGLMKMYPGRTFSIKGNSDAWRLSIGVFASDDWPDYDPSSRVIKTFDVFRLIRADSYSEALAELKIGDTHPVATEISKARGDLLGLKPQ